MTPTDANNAVVETSSATPEVEQSIPAAGPERIEWQKTGTLPKAASTPAPEGEQSPKSAPASEAGKQEKKSPAALRLEEVLADLKAAGFDGPADLKTFKREAAKTTQAEPSPAKQPEVKAAPAAEAPTKPDMKDPKYEGDAGWELYEADVDKYNRAFASFEAKNAVEAYKREQTQQEQLKHVLKQIETGRKTYADFDQRTEPVFKALTANLDSPVSQVVGESPVFEHLMYAIGQQGEEFLALVKSNPQMALKKAVILESLVMEELSKGKTTEEKPRDDKGQFLPPEKKAKTVSDAPPPPHEVGGKGTPPADEVEAALKSGDQTRYNDLMNRRDLANRKR